MLSTRQRIRIGLTFGLFIAFSVVIGYLILSAVMDVDSSMILGLMVGSMLMTFYAVWPRRNPALEGQSLAVPDVSGKSKFEAIKVLRETGFVVEVKTSKYPGDLGPAVSTDPAAGQDLLYGSTVRLYVHRGAVYRHLSELLPLP